MEIFWVGDWVRDRESQQIGRFEGVVNGMATIRFAEKIFSIRETLLEKLPDKEEEAMIILEKQMLVQAKERIKDNPKEEFNDTLDLHIEKLAPHLKGKRTELIIQKQINSARKFVFEAIDRRRFQITLIHGKGTGALKMEIESLLMEFDEVYFTKTVNNGGAVEVLFNY